MKTEQTSMFELLNEYETPMLPIEKQKCGVKGWIIEVSCICLKKNGHDRDWIGVCTRPIVFEQSTRKDSDGILHQYAQTTRGPYHGWWGPVYTVFTRRPSWNDCVRYVREHRHSGDPEEVRYYEIIGLWDDAKHEY